MFRTLFGVALLALASCTSTQRSADAPPLYDGMGNHHRAVTTSSPRAQRYFDQGLTFAYAFNHDEAIRAFKEAARLDPNCAMAWWGIALCNGPHINNPAMDEAHSLAAWDALQKARAASANATAVERALINALASRYASPPPADRIPLDRAYAAQMKKVRALYPRDTDVGTLYAESLMDLRPWDLWAHDGTPRPETPEVVATLESVLQADPNHPGANHLYIHAVEASYQPERAVAAAYRLRTLVPATGHLVHMPAHIDVRTGQWEKAVISNQTAIAADDTYRKKVPEQHFYHVYMAHNHHFLSYACMMEGRSAESLQAARDMIAGVPPVFLETAAPLIDGLMGIEIHSLMRFGKWEEILAQPAPPQQLLITTSFWHFARACAYAATDRISEAESEQAAFKEAVAAVPENAMMMVNKAHKVLSIADHVLIGEIAFRKGDIDEAVTHLTEAAKIEDDLQYMEPPEWIQPVRHTLGAVLVSAGRMEEAEKVYRDDLARWPENGWSLYGLAECLEARNDPEAAQVRARFEKAWARADTEIGSTCLCVPARN